MKIIISFALLVMFFTPLFFGSCTKEVLKEVVVTDTVKIVTNNITGMDSVKADFVYTISYSADSTGYATVYANTASFNVPSDAVYSWALDGNLQIVNNQTYYVAPLAKAYNGPHLLAMTITCPGLKKVFTIAKTFTTKLKG